MLLVNLMQDGRGSPQCPVCAWVREAGGVRTMPACLRRAAGSSPVTQQVAMTTLLQLGDRQSIRDILRVEVHGF